jgi:hypothetical protein
MPYATGLKLAGTTHRDASLRSRAARCARLRLEALREVRKHRPSPVRVYVAFRRLFSPYTSSILVGAFGGAGALTLA